jgi:D-serine deaminase-like pyridoxal phosphate-dependent protein
MARRAPPSIDKEACAPRPGFAEGRRLLFERAMALSYEAMRDALAGTPLPALVVDLDAFDRNLDRHVAVVRPYARPIRVASKSVRIAALLRRLLERGGPALKGLMCYAAPEAEFLAGEGFDDLLVAYPVFQRRDAECLARLAAAGKTAIVAVDSAPGVARLAEVASTHGATVPVVICIDMSTSILGGRALLGVRRSPLREPAEVVALARAIAETSGVSFRGLLTYEAQVAGLGDDSPFERAMNPIKRVIKRASVADVARRRSEVVEALRSAGLPPSIVNGGGTGSLETTTPDAFVTEVTAGSGFFKPHLFDYYRSSHVRSLEPAAFFALEITRTPGPGYVTCLGGGYVASGAVGRDKAPRPYLPPGLSLLPMEMCGEVQTPLATPPSSSLSLGDPVFFRHAKGGELCERFETAYLLSNGAVVGAVPTYRGQGRCFF